MTSGKIEKSQVEGLFEGVFANESLPKRSPLCVPLSDKYYYTKMKDNYADLIVHLQNIGADFSTYTNDEKTEIFGIILMQVKKMALFGPMRPKLLELNTFEILHRALADNLDCVNDVVAECSSAFISNMSMSTNQRLPEARDWAETISPHVTTMLEVMSIVGEKGYDEMAVLHAYGYAIASMCEQPVTLKQLLVKSSHQRYVMKFLMQHSRGEDRDAAQSMVPKLCIKSLIILVRAALDSTEGSNEEFLPGFDDDIAKEALEILFKWHIEYYPWIWVHKPSVAQMMPNLLGEYVNIRSDCTKICQIWASKNAYRSTDEAVDKPIVFEACCAVVREMLATPADKLPMTVDNGGLRIGIFSVSPNYDFYVKFAAETGLGDLS